MATPHDEAFLQAIRENPDDDAPRLIYADWLEERGDPRRAGAHRGGDGPAAALLGSLLATQAAPGRVASRANSVS